MSKDIAQKYYEKQKFHKNLKKEVNTSAMISFGIAISPFFFWWVYIIPIANIVLSIITLPLFITGIIFGFTGLNKINNNSEIYKGRGFAITGIIINLIYCMIILLIAILGILFYI